MGALCSLWLADRRGRPRGGDRRPDGCRSRALGRRRRTSSRLSRRVFNDAAVRYGASHDSGLYPRSSGLWPATLLWTLAAVLRIVPLLLESPLTRSGVPPTFLAVSFGLSGPIGIVAVLLLAITLFKTSPSIIYVARVTSASHLHAAAWLSHAGTSQSKGVFAPDSNLRDVVHNLPI